MFYERFVIVLGSETLLRFAQLINTSAFKAVTPWGILILVSALHISKVHEPIDLIPVSSKTPFSRVVNVFGRITSVRFVQPKNNSFDSFVTLSGIIIFVNFLQKAAILKASLANCPDIRMEDK